MRGVNDEDYDLARRFMEQTYGPMPRNDDDPREEKWMSRFGLLYLFTKFLREQGAEPLSQASTIKPEGEAA